MSKTGEIRESTPNEYENERTARIKRNKRILESLDLESALQALRTGGSNANAGAGSSHPHKKTRKTAHNTSASPSVPAIGRPNLRSRSARTGTQTDHEKHSGDHDFMIEEIEENTHGSNESQQKK